MRGSTETALAFAGAVLFGVAAQGADVMYADRAEHELRIGYSNNNDVPIPVRTVCRIVPGEKELKFFLRAEDADIAAVRKCREEDGVWGCCENFELFFDPTGAGKGYTQLAVSASGAMYDSRKKRVSVGSKAANAVDTSKPNGGYDWTKEVRLLDGAWELDVTIPWTAFGGTRPETGDFWRFNVTRSFKPVGGVAEDGTWAHVGPMYKNAAGFGTLYFGSPDEVARAQAARNAALAEKLTAQAAALGVADAFAEKLSLARTDATGRRLKSVADELTIVEILNR